MNNDLIVKPTFDGEIIAKIKSLGEIESNIKDVKEFATNLNEYYSKIVFDENSMKVAKEEKAKINKFKDQVSNYRKEIIKQWKEPITQFETMAKETESILSDTYSTINNQSKKFDEEKKMKKENELREFFNEYVKSNEIDFLSFENVGLNITLSTSEKALKEQIVAFIDKIIQDLQVIDSQENKTEILVEYKQNLDLNKSILIVAERKRRLQEERERQERLVQERLEAEKKATAEALQNFIPKEEEKVEEEIVAPTKVVEEKKYTLNFSVTGTMQQLSLLKSYMNSNKLEVKQL